MISLQFSFAGKVDFQVSNSLQNVVVIVQNVIVEFKIY